MFTLLDIQTLVLNAIDLGGFCHTTRDLSSTDRVYLSCSIKDGLVSYYMAVIKNDEYDIDFPNCSLEFILNYEFYYDVPPYTQAEFLTLYSTCYSLNKSQLAVDLGVTRQTIHQWYTCERPIPLIYKKFIALDLSISPELLDFDFQPSIPVCPLTKQRLHDLPF